METHCVTWEVGTEFLSIYYLGWMAVPMRLKLRADNEVCDAVPGDGNT
jgi:hypothetical protein